MIKLIDIVPHPTLVQEIVGQFAFMKIMSQPGDRNHDHLDKIDLNQVYNNADEFFVQFTAFEEIIITKECSLQDKITEFLKPYAGLVDVLAIQQNIHFRLKALDRN